MLSPKSGACKLGNECWYRRDASTGEESRRRHQLRGRAGFVVAINRGIVGRRCVQVQARRLPPPTPPGGSQVAYGTRVALASEV
eukprot:643767-Lingulodinium_polyedra.AAC.1